MTGRNGWLSLARPEVGRLRSEGEIGNQVAAVLRATPPEPLWFPTAFWKSTASPVLSVNPTAPAGPHSVGTSQLNPAENKQGQLNRDFMGKCCSVDFSPCEGTGCA